MIRILILVNTLFVLIWVNSQVFGNERIRTTGKVIRLELAPVDPRSFMQGDYMILNYAIAREGEPVNVMTSAGLTRAKLLLNLDENHVATFDSVFDEDDAPGAQQAVIRARKSRRGVQVAPLSYFFEEGRAEDFESAKFAELRVSTDGDVILTHLLDGELNRIQ